MINSFKMLIICTVISKNSCQKKNNNLSVSNKDMKWNTYSEENKTNTTKAQERKKHTVTS